MSKTFSSNKLNFFLNTFEQQIEIDKRLNELFNCLKISDHIRTETEQSKLKLKDKINTSFNALRGDLTNLEAKIFKKIEQDLLKNQIDVPIRNLENNINQLIGNLNSLSLLKDSEKLLCIKSIDASIENIKTDLKSIDNYKKSHIDNLNSSQHYLNNVLVNQIEKIQNVIRTESINLNSQVFNNAENLNYNHWLLKSDGSGDRPRLERANSYEFINFNQELDELVTDMDEIEEKLEKCNFKSNGHEFSVARRFNESSKTDCVTKLFNNIYSKPIDYWLLNQK